MPVVPLHQYLMPDFRIRINRVLLGARFTDAISEVSVDENPHWPSMFAFTLEPGAEGATIPWLDNPKVFAVGHVVLIELGLAGEFGELIEGEITALEPEFSARSRPRLVVRGFDRGHRLRRGRKTRSFANQKDSDIARAIAVGAGLQTRIGDSEVVHEFLMQTQCSDWDFLAQRARAIGFELRVDKRTLVFEPRRIDAAPTKQLELGQQLFEFRPRLSTATQLTEVNTRGWDVDGNALRSATAASAKVALGGAATSGPGVVKRAFGAAAETIALPPSARNDAEQRQLAQARLDDAALGLIEGEALCGGEPELRAGRCVEVKGVGSRFGGMYYIASTRHRYDSGGYTTHLQLQRSHA